MPGGGLADIADMAASNGLKAVAVSVGHYVDAVEASGSPAEVRRTLDGLGVRVSVVDPLISPLPGTPRADDVDAARRRFFTYTEDDCCRAADVLGASTINLAHYLGMPISRAELQDAVGSIAERHHARGFATTLEFIPDSGVPDLAAAIEIVSVSTHARIMFDTWHFARSGGTVEQLAELRPGVIGGVQISDRVLPPEGYTEEPLSGRRAPNKGELPLAAMIAAIQSSSPGLDIGIEVFSEELKALGWQAAGARMAAGGRAVLAAARALKD